MNLLWNLSSMYKSIQKYAYVYNFTYINICYLKKHTTCFLHFYVQDLSLISTCFAIWELAPPNMVTACLNMFLFCFNLQVILQLLGHNIQIFFQLHQKCIVKHMFWIKPCTVRLFPCTVMCLIFLYFLHSSVEINENKIFWFPDFVFRIKFLN